VVRGLFSATPHRHAVVVFGVGLLGLYALIAVAALLGLPWLFLALVLAAHCLDLAADRVALLSTLLQGAGAGLGARCLLRDLALALLAVQVLPPGEAVAVAAGTTALALARTAYRGMLLPLGRLTTPRVEVRNVDLSGIRAAPRPHRFLLERAAARLHNLALLAVLGGAIAAGTGALWAYLVPLALALTVVGAGIVVVFAEVLRCRGRLRGEKLLRAVNERVCLLRPRTVLYFSGSPESTYQVNVWLSTMEQLGHPALIVLRERETLRRLGETTTPVVCIPRTVDFLSFRLPDVRVALYAANVGKNIHLLRAAGVRHVFIGHGDSDKTASFNPFSKVYSEIWVAGPAGRDRYLRAGVGVRDDEIVEVGRPQLSGIQPAGAGPAAPMFTVLYAPTWEGWTTDPFNTSLVLAGPDLVEGLLAARPRVRVVYKPHPLTGTVSPAAARAHERIVARLESENLTRAGDRAVSADPALAEREPGWWGSEPPWACRVVSGSGADLPTLYDCFNASDLLVADISSVVSDFVASQKPYVVTNLFDLDDEAFRRTYPSAAAGYLLDRHAANLDEVLALVRGADPLAARRQAHKEYLLGPDSPDALTRFKAAIEAAAAAAQRSRDAAEREAATEVAAVRAARAARSAGSGLDGGTRGLDPADMGLNGDHDEDVDEGLAGALDGGRDGGDRGLNGDPDQGMEVDVDAGSQRLDGDLEAQRVDR